MIWQETRDPWGIMGTVSKTLCRKVLFYESKKNTEIEGNVKAWKGVIELFSMCLEKKQKLKILIRFSLLPRNTTR